jgi:hypothetical protein
VRHRKDLGKRRHERVGYRRRGFIIPEPFKPWLDCLIVDVSAGGICIKVGALAIPKVFGVAFNSDGTIIRVCSTAWRRGGLIGASFLSAKQLRERQQPAPCLARAS